MPNDAQRAIGARSATIVNTVRNLMAVRMLLVASPEAHCIRIWIRGGKEGALAARDTSWRDRVFALAAKASALLWAGHSAALVGSVATFPIGPGD